MTWLVFSYSFSAGVNSSFRVSIWRKLGRLGAITPKASVCVLPDREECFESFQWLAQEVQQAKGEAVVMRVNKFEGLSDGQLIKLFQQARKDDYTAIELELDRLQKNMYRKDKILKPSQRVKALKKIRSRFSDINQVDFFDSPEAGKVRDRMDKIQSSFSSSTNITQQIPQVSIGQYKDKQWVTRPNPHVDRLACAWLIRRFINPRARIRYSNEPKTHEVAFDMKGVVFGHQGNFCSFETMIHAFGFKDEGLMAMTEIVHEIDLKDNRYVRSETEGIAAVLNGWRLAEFSDKELESHGISLFEGLYVSLTHKNKTK